MYGRMKPSDKHQDIVNRYIQENNPYIAREPLHFDLRAYDTYMREHSITDPEQIPKEVISKFASSDQDRSTKSSDDQERAV